MANLSSFDLNLLRVLNALLQDPSTVRAGERLGLSQPAVSAALGRLRGALGDELFFRSGQRLQPTDYALSLQEPLWVILGDIEALIRDRDAFDPAQSTISFRVSGSDYFAEMLMPRLAEVLQAQAPGMRIHLVDLVPDNHVASLERFDVDIALIPHTTTPDWANTRPMLMSDFQVIARRGHPRLRRAGITPGEVVPLDLFCDLGHVVFSPEGNARAMGDAALARVGRERRVVMTLPVFSGVYRAVAGSDLVALLPGPLARHVAESEGLEVFAPPMPVPEVQLSMVWHRRNEDRQSHVWMRDVIARIVADVPAPSPTPQAASSSTPAATSAASSKDRTRLL